MNRLVFNRREALFLAAGASATTLFAATPFWEKRDPKDWTHDEIDKLTSNSPWAKEVSAQFPNRDTYSNSPAYPSDPGAGRSGGDFGIPGIGIGGGGRGGGGGQG